MDSELVDLDGTAWLLTGWDEPAGPPADPAITAAFADGSVTGRSAVNRYSAPVTVGADGSFRTGPVGMTLRAGPDDAMRAEAVFVRRLESATSYAVDGGQLVLRQGPVASLIFAPR